MSTGSTLSEDSNTDNEDSFVQLESPAPVKTRQKNNKENRRNGVVVLEPMLPPCRICAEKASGFHYGANTCEACKAFFRRSLHKGAKYKCSAGGTCEVLPGKRNSCPACRLKKCIDIGMSKSAVKTGRYTHAKKARDIMEVKGLRKDVSSEETVSLNVNSTIKKKPSSNEERKPRSSESDVEEMNQIIERITKVQVERSTWTPEFKALKDKNEKLYLEQRALQEEIFGPMKPISRDEFMRIYASTGIEVDSRRDILQAAFFPYADDCIKRYVLFLKSIPGFVQLPIKDQTALIKASSFDSWMLLSQRAFNPDEKLFINQCGLVISLDDLDSLCDEHAVNELMFECQKKLQKLDLTQEENCTLAAMSVMTTDNCELEAVDQVAQSHLILLNCFLHLVDKFHSDDPLFIARVVLLLVEMRTLRALHKRIEDKVALQWSGMVEIPPLLAEIWSTGDLKELV